MAALVWKPQKCFKDHFKTDMREIIRTHSIFAAGVQYHIDYGGRGSGKTWTWADAVVVEATLRKVRILVTREFQNSIEESVKDEIETAITNRGLDWFFDCKKTDITAKNGSKFIFKGIRNNIKSLKSISNVDIVLCEESENILKESWDKLLPSIRPKSGLDPIFIIIFNPDNELDDTYQRWIVNTPPGSVCRLINWSDNKYFPDHLNKQRLHAKATMPPKEYAHIWEGVPKGSGDDVIIQLDWIKAARFASRKEGFKQVGINVAAYDPAGQGRDFNAAMGRQGNIVNAYDEWLRSDDLRMATQRAMQLGESIDADMFRYDECGGFGDGVSVFVEDMGKEDPNSPGFTGMTDKDGHPIATINIDEVIPFNAGDTVIDPDEIINGTNKTNEETYTNSKAQAHGITAQLLYNTFRFVALNEDVAPEDMISIDIEDDTVFNKLARELSTPIWVKSQTNSRKKVESKKDMEKRTGLASPNLADAFHMLFAPYEKEAEGFHDVYIRLAQKAKKQQEESRAQGAGAEEKESGGGFSGLFG